MYRINRVSKYNKFWVGFVTGMVLPILGFLLSKEVKAPEVTMARYWQIFTDGELQVNKDIIVFSILPNMVLFYVFFFQLKYDNLSKGLVLVTLLVGGFSFILTA